MTSKMDIEERIRILNHGHGPDEVCTVCEKLIATIKSWAAEKEKLAYEGGVNSLSQAITSQLNPVVAWDSQEALYNSLVHKLVKRGVAVCAIDGPPRGKGGKDVSN